MDTPDPKVTIELTLSQLLSLTVYPDDDGGGETMADLIATRFASSHFAGSHGSRETWNAVESEVRSQVRERVSAALASPPDSESSLHAMIIAEAKAQLTDRPDSYPGTATPMAQYISALVYEAIREPALQAVERVKAEVEETVERAVRVAMAERWPNVGRDHG